MKFLKRQSALLLLGIFLLAGALVSGIVHAQTGATTSDIPIQTEIIIPGSEPIFDSGLLRGRVGDLANYLSIIYNFLISIVGVVAGAFILVGGFQYLTAGGDASRVTSAKQRIGNALIGLVLALSSYVLLNTINPDLVNLELPEGLRKRVTTQLSYVPFCDTLAKQFTVPMTDIKQASGVGATYCGAVGFLESGETVDEKGNPVSGRIWCAYRGTEGRDEGLAGGCKYDVKTTGEVWSNNLEHAATVCMLLPSVSADDLEKAYDENPILDPIGFCSACWDLSLNKGVDRIVSDGFGGDIGAACQAWQNTANNGDPSDFGFTYEHKKETGFTLEGKNQDRVYYCGLRDGNRSCASVEIECRNLDKCEEYEEKDKTKLYYCNWEATTVDCRDEPLKTRFGGSYYLHLGRVCRANPCGAAGNCSAGTLTDLLQTSGVSTGGTAGTAYQMVTLGFGGTCD